MNLQDFMASAHSDSLARNQQGMFTWTKYKEDLKTTQALLKTLPDKLSHEVMVPLGSKAMMPGKIVHTNELLVSLGAGYFTRSTAKQATEYCGRKIQSCDEMLGKLEQELNLLANKLSVPQTHDAFGAADRPEIIEHVTEEEENLWKLEHRKKEKEYRAKLAQVRKVKQKIESEEDLWNRLDELELEEELEDELNRLHEGDEDTDSNEEEEDDDGNEEDDEIEADEEIKQEEAIVDVSQRRRKRSVIFAEEIKEDAIEPLRLNFSHSSAKTSQKSQASDVIASPADIYPKYLSDLRGSNPVSILKVRKNPNQKKEAHSVSLLSDDDEVEENDEDDFVQFRPSGFEIPGVLERTQSEVVEATTAPPRRVSKFKASRMNKGK